MRKSLYFFDMFNVRGQRQITNKYKGDFYYEITKNITFKLFRAERRQTSC